MDLSQVMIANLMIQLGNHKNAQVDENMMRHMILNSVRKYNQKFKDDFGELVICADDKQYWRRDVFAPYKANRRAARKKDELDWDTIFKALHTIRDEMKEHLPYKVLQVPRAEADDVIGALCHYRGQHLGNNDPILILSGDKDYQQLHGYTNVQQYNPRTDKYMRCNNPTEFLYEHIMKGDSGDGIPNVLSADDVFITKTRQKPMTQKRLEEWRKKENRPEDVQKNFERNKRLIDLSCIPEDVNDAILSAYENQTPPSRKKIYPYFVKKRLKNLMENIQEF